MRFAEKKTENLIIKIEPSIKDILQNLAADEGVSMSEYVRVLILEEIKRKQNGDDPE